MSDPKQAPEGEQTGQADAASPELQVEALEAKGRMKLKPRSSQRCPQCGEMFDPSSVRQKYCTRACNLAFSNAKRGKPAKTGRVASERGREAKDGLRCRTCAGFIDNREGYRLDCKSCSRTKMKAIHSRFMCTRKGCIVCMEATLARSPEFVAAWEAEAE